MGQTRDLVWGWVGRALCGAWWHLTSCEAPRDRIFTVRTIHEIRRLAHSDHHDVGDLISVHFRSHVDPDIDVADGDISSAVLVAGLRMEYVLD